MRPKMIHHNTLIGERGIALIASIFSEMGLVWYPTGSVEAGIDGHVELRDSVTGEVFNAVFGVQSKATDRPFDNETETSFDFYCDRRDLNYWLRGNLPVVLVVTRPSTQEAYCVSVKDYFKDPASLETRKIRFDKRRDRLSSDSKEALFLVAVPRDAGIYLAPPILNERLISNLLPISFLPARLYVANTHLRTGPAVWQQAQEHGSLIGGEWIFRSKQLISFRDLRFPQWAEFCDAGTAEDFATEEWSLTDDEDRRRDFVDLLRRTLREMVRSDLAFNEREELFYFRPTADLSPRELPYQSLARSTDRIVFKAYPAGDGGIKYYRHSAFQDRFRLFDDQWYLEITPTYYFTSDGYRPRWNQHNFLKRIKEIEGHEAVRGQVIMWASFLTPRADMFNTEPYPFLGFKDLLTFDVTRGIEDSAWERKKAQVSQVNGDSEIVSGDSNMQLSFGL